MAKMISALLLGVVLLGVSQPGLSLTAMKKVVASNNDFAMDLYGQIRSKSTGENIFFSSFSVSSALAMVYAGARGNTKTEMENVLQLSGVSTNDVHIGFGKLFEALNDPTNNYTLSAANALFGRKGYPFLQTYLDIVTKYYNALLKTLDFGGNSEASRKFINDWVASNTNQKIKDLLSSSAVTSSTVAVLVNTIYFKGLWKNQFKVKNTKSSTFHMTSTNSMTAKMMNLYGKSFNYAEISSLNSKIIELPYEGDEVSMYIVLPNSVNGLPALESQLTSSKLNNAIYQMSSTKVDVSMPKFKMTQQVELNTILQSMGMKDLFGKADLSGIDGTHKLVVSKVVHKAYIDVNEEGTEAAAATAVVIVYTSSGPPKTFKADHPFLFFIREKVTGSILFSGRVLKPQEGNAGSSGTESEEKPPCCKNLPDFLCQLVLEHLSHYWCYGE